MSVIPVTILQARRRRWKQKQHERKQSQQQSIMQANFSENDPDSDFEYEEESSSEEEEEAIDERHVGYQVPCTRPELRSPTELIVDVSDIGQLKRNARKRSNGTHWMDTGYGTGHGRAWFAECERKFRPLSKLPPRDLRARAKSSGASQAEIEAVEQDPERPPPPGRGRKDCWLNNALIALIKRKRDLQQLQKEEGKARRLTNRLNSFGLARKPTCTCKSGGQCLACTAVKPAFDPNYIALWDCSCGRQGGCFSCRKYHMPQRKPRLLPPPLPIRVDAEMERRIQLERIQLWRDNMMEMEKQEKGY